MTMGDSWSYIFKENYKSPRRLVHTLCDIVSKGGNLLLNVAPGPDGAWHQEAYERSRDIGAWMHANGEAIYRTKMPANGRFRDGHMVFTQKGGTTYAIYMAETGEDMLPEQVRIPNFSLTAKTNIVLLGCDKPLKYKQVGNDVMVWMPDQMRKAPPCRYAWTFRIEG